MRVSPTGWAKAEREKKKKKKTGCRNEKPKKETKKRKIEALFVHHAIS